MTVLKDIQRSVLTLMNADLQILIDNGGRDS